MARNFCTSCSRLRIISDGNLEVCIFGQAEVSLRDINRKGKSGQPIDENFKAAKTRLKPQR
ncbi:Molybdenum cofactor biosynthesis protein 1 [Golovinomyces cichoracearum]|uniref:Molybdenum cofactor biosynthesis protein 1 n=1 Tax=Golovinomyces cichoracearum TaxID=62708 RepID=A0A420J8E5_9PEZI|nr:Molybdenum cofactor biosynthesis protein 1 [Golovinomyces cichoracearum]